MIRKNERLGASGIGGDSKCCKKIVGGCKPAVNLRMHREKFRGVALEQLGEFADFVETFPDAAFDLEIGLKECEICDSSTGIGHCDNTSFGKIIGYGVC